MSRFLVGIDLGTTHTVVAYADRTRAQRAIEPFEIEQLVAPGELAGRPMLPSLRYHPAPGELDAASVATPWPRSGLEGALPQGVTGELARILGEAVPGRLVSSAKSWLSYAGVDRNAPILPWGAPSGVPKISPVDASAAYLAYLRSAWNHRMPAEPLERQEVVLTVPASFDEGARALTLAAAGKAGLTVRLLEEPQAACYDWLHRNAGRIGEALDGARLLLVADIGGGTTDLTLIRIEPGDPQPTLTRVGVGEHLMLGGDNMDLSLAHLAEGRLPGDGGRLSAAALAQLVQQCRRAKERLLAPGAPEQAAVTVLGSGARLVGGARSVALGRDEVRARVLDGFFPLLDANAGAAAPRRARTGIVEIGLPYAADPAVSRHLAAFLQRHQRACREALAWPDQPQAGASRQGLACPDAVLLNGGLFLSAALADRTVELLARWRGEPLRVLDNPGPERAVARGAVAYALARLGRGLRIGGGSARSYFLPLEAEGGRRGVCILPRGTEEGRELRLAGRTFALRLGQPVRLQLVSSTGDRTPSAGEVVALNAGETEILPPVATVLEGAGAGGAEVPVRLVSALTELGTLSVACEAEDGRRWGLELDLRGPEGQTAGAAERRSHPRVPEAAARIERVFGARSKDVPPKEVKTLRSGLERILGKREEWDTALLRELYGHLWSGLKRRRRSADHERVWFNLAGFCARPGFGHPLDEWRIGQLWSVYDPGVQFAAQAQNWSEWWTLWRRVCGGLGREPQETLLDAIDPLLPPADRRKVKVKPPLAASIDDAVRLAACLERVPAERKVAVGETLLQRLGRKDETVQTWWALGRLGSRVPFHGSAHEVVPAEVGEAWLDRVLELDWRAVQPAAFAATMLARMSGDRGRDLPPERRAEVARRLQAMGAPATWVGMVCEVTGWQEADARRAFGDSLPPGLRLLD